MKYTRDELNLIAGMCADKIGKLNAIGIRYGLDYEEEMNVFRNLLQKTCAVRKSEAKEDPDLFRAETSFGTIFAEWNGDPDRPSVFVSLREQGEDEDTVTKVIACVSAHPKDDDVVWKVAELTKDGINVKEVRNDERVSRVLCFQ